MVPARPRRAAGFGAPRLLRLVGRRQGLCRHAHHLLRHGKVQLDLGPGGRRLFLAPLLFAPARPELRQSAGAARSAGRDALLAGHGRGRPAPGRGALPGRAGRHQQREPAGNPRHPAAHPPRHRQRVSRQDAAGRGQPVARGRARVLRRRRRMPHGVPLSPDAAHVHGHRAGGPPARHRHHPPDAVHRAAMPMGHFPAQPRRADPGDGDQPRTRLPVERLRGRAARAHQPGHPAPPGAAARARPAPHRTDEQPAAVHAGHAGAVLRRRAGHGRQHPPGRPRRRAHAHAMVARPQRRLLARRPRAPAAAAADGAAVRLRGGQRGGAAARPAFAAELDPPHAGQAPPEPCVRPWRTVVPVSGQPQDPGLSAHLGRHGGAVRGQPFAGGPAGRTAPVRVRRPRTGGNAGRHRLSADRRAALSADAAAFRLLLAGPERRRRAARVAQRAAAANAGIDHPGVARRGRGAAPDRGIAPPAGSGRAAGLPAAAALVCRAPQARRAARSWARSPTPRCSPAMRACCWRP
ncbi:Uncharacterised protein [Bordetella pertussis]|nr:Uncharacterised protein [Bordetella pertussis]